MIDVRAVGDGEMEMRLRSTSSSSSSGDDVMKWCRAPVHEVDGTCTVSAMHIHSAGSHQPCVTGSVQPTRASLSSTDLRNRACFDQCTPFGHFTILNGIET